MIPSLTSRRCAPSPRATRAPNPHSACSAGRRSSRLVSCMGPRPVSRLQHRRRRRGSAPRWAGAGRRLLRASEGAPRPPRARIRAKSAPSRLWMLIHRCSLSHVGTFTRVAAPIGGVAPTPRVPDVAAGTAATTADLFGARRGRSREVRGACKKRCMCVRVATCAAVAWPDTVAAAAALPGPPTHVARDSPRRVCRVGAGHSAVAAPSQCAELGGRRGLPAARNGRNGRRVVAEAVGARRTADGSVGGVRGAHAARSAAAAAAARPPRARHWRCSCRCDLATARLTPIGASGSPEAAPGGLGAVRRWPMVPPGPAGVAVAPLMCCRDRHSTY